MSFRMRHIEMSRIVSAPRLHIKAVAAAFFINDSDSTPPVRHATSIGEYKANTLPLSL
jgi:hypothetical protein